MPVFSGGENVGILTDVPGTIRFSPLIGEVIRLSEYGVLDDEKISSLLKNKVSPDELSNALGEIRELFRNVPRKMPFLWQEKLVSSLYFDLPEDNSKAADLVRRAIDFFGGQLDHAVFLTFNVKSISDLSSLASLCGALAASHDHSYKIVVECFAELAGEEIVEFVLSGDCEVKLLLDCRKNPNSALKRVGPIVKQLTASRVISARIIRPDLLRDDLEKAVSDLSRMGVGIIESGYGECSLFDCGRNIENTDKSQPTHSSAAANVAEILNHLTTLSSFSPKAFACGAGKWYRAISVNGDIFPCYRFIGSSEYRLGSIECAPPREQTGDEFAVFGGQEREECRICWARFICGGGCIADWKDHTDKPRARDGVRCDNIRRNIKAAALLSADRSSAGKLILQKRIDLLRKHSPQFRFPDAAPPGDALVLSTVGKSMFPLFKSGTGLRIEFLHPNQLRAGDILSYVRNDKIITHRLILRLRRMPDIYFYEKGDNGFFQEVRPQEIVGRISQFKNEDMSGWISTAGFLIRLSGKAIVLYTIAAWSLVFVAKFAINYVSLLVRMRFNFSGAARSLLTGLRFEFRSGALLGLINSPVRLADRFVLLIYRTAGKIWTA